MLYTNLLQLADTSGCGHYRALFPAWNIRTKMRNVKFVETQIKITDPKFYRHFRHVMIQRGVTNSDGRFFANFLKPLSDMSGFWTSYNIDDAIGKADMPRYNTCWNVYQNEEHQTNISNMLRSVDFVVVTTDELRQYYVDNYGVEYRRCVVIPNYLPRWWVGEAYDVDKRVMEYSENIKKPRIGFTSSLSHFDVKDENGGIDDFTEMCRFIRATWKKYQYVFIGYCPKQLDDLAHDKKIEVHRSSDLLNFLREVGDKELQMIIAPLRDNTFNRCKSNIKLIESWALGIPFIGANIPTYSKYTNSVFSDHNSLQNKMDEILQDKNRYKKTIKNNRRVIDFGDKMSPNGWWLEKNIQTWMKLFTLPPKTIRIDYDTAFKPSSDAEEVSISI